MKDILCFIVCLSPIIWALYKLCNWLYDRIYYQKKFRTSELIERHCRDCKHAYMGDDYLHHCHLMTSIKICHPKNMDCYRRKEG